ncbi:hypothetical protein BGZ57DRAFT_935963 [Hyaloscypha finlandica]|nr:hypothetical protein BGZ57DRAFT_935963 [Hyaloscypha finlandica]KAH8756193.1 hypothetical protein F5882DRAFT_469011 [Hyaloscypha sp. PMI_1271]
MMIYHSEPGVDLNNASSSSVNPAAQTFVRLTEIVASRKGYRHQFWGYQVDNPGLFVWSIDWKSIEDYIVFRGSKDYVEVEGDLGQLFDLDAATPVTLLLNIHRHESATNAFRSGVTEVAFFSFPSRPRQEMRVAINEGCDQ